MEGPVVGNIAKYASDSFFGEAGVTGIVGPDEDTPMSKGAAMSFVAYRAQEHARGHRIPRADRMRLASLDEGQRSVVEQGYVSKPLSTLRTAREIEVANLYFADSTWQDGSSDITPAIKWDVTATPGDPIKDIDNAKRLVENWGVTGNMCILGRQSAYNLVHNPTFLEYLPTNVNRNMVSDDMLAEILKNLMGFESVHIGYGRKNTSKIPGTPSMSDIWGDRVFVGHAPHDAAGNVSTLGAPGFNGEIMASDASATARIITAPLAVHEYDDNAKRGHVYEVSYFDALMRFQAECGALILQTST